MRRRLVMLCLLAYPRACRQRDRRYLCDLALELAETDGLPRQLASLLRGGLGERIARRRLRRAARSAGWRRRVVVGCAAVVATAFAASGLTAFAAGGVEQVEDEREAAVAAGSGPTRASVERVLARILPAGAGGTLVAVRGGETVYCEGFGMADRETRVPASCDTVYDVMSMTKQFTATAIVKLETMGKLRVTDPIGRYVGPVPAGKRGITVQQLLTHTSGLVEALGGDYERQSRRGMVARALASRLQSRPGAEHHYSNVGYSLLAAIVESASGMGYEEFLAAHLFAPAGMTQTGYVLPRWKRARVAVEYDAHDRPHGTPFDHPWAADGPYWNLRGNGGMLSTARDMARWHRALQGERILGARAKRELLEPRVREEPGGDAFYGYGWVVQRTAAGTVAWHNGGNAWSYGELTLLPGSGTMVFWVTNRSTNAAARWSFERLGPKLTRAVVRAVTRP